MNRFINENIKPGEQIETSSTPQMTTTTPTNSILSKTNKRKQTKSTDIQSEITNNKSNEQINLNQWISTESNTNAIQLIRHILTNETRMNK
jgi:hypothetical protein